MHPEDPAVAFFRRTGYWPWEYEQAMRAKAAKERWENAEDMLCLLGGVATPGSCKALARTRVKSSGAPAKEPDVHHVQTDKNNKSKAAGGPYTPKFEDLAKKRGTTLQDPKNKVPLPDHQGPHAEYNKRVFERMRAATNGLKGKEFKEAYDKELAAIRAETAKPGTELNALSTGKEVQK